MTKLLQHSRAGTGMRVIALALLAVAASAQAAPLLRCQVTYAGTTHLVEAVPGTDPYRAPSVDIGGRFRFKAVVLGSRQRIDAINLYAYIDTRRQPVLIHQAKYLPPFRKSAAPYALTGHNSLYASNVERELQYSCTLQGVQS
ncbi:hypothetical protein [Herminiimonas sp. CN]|uniref:hypothetical protein n=1 Tax=Herminiimonas sp. CN TaxID=1349818 RepID=UPI000473616F|nr:hypothetical protein [Herminiimonas sp. CN]